MRPSSHCIYSYPRTHDAHPRVPSRIEDAPIVREANRLNVVRGGQGRSEEEVICSGATLVWPLGVALVVGCVLFYIVTH